MARAEFALNVTVSEQPIPRPLPRQLVVYLLVWNADKQAYGFIVVEAADLLD